MKQRTHFCARQLPLFAVLFIASLTLSTLHFCRAGYKIIPCFPSSHEQRLQMYPSLRLQGALPFLPRITCNCNRNQEMTFCKITPWKVFRFFNNIMAKNTDVHLEGELPHNNKYTEQKMVSFGNFRSARFLFPHRTELRHERKLSNLSKHKYYF